MKKKVIGLWTIAVLVLAVIGILFFMINRADSDLDETSVISEYYAPPNIVPSASIPLTYQYTTEVPANRPAITAQNQESVIRTSYYYTDDAENEYVFDTEGRVRGYTNLSLDSIHSVSFLSEEGCKQAAENLAETLSVDLSAFTQVQYDESSTGATVTYRKNPDTIYCSSANFNFTTDGLLVGFSCSYTDVDILSDSDYSWFTSEIKKMISCSKYADWPSVTESETCYRIENTLCYQTTVTFLDEDGNKHPEIFFASKPLE